MATARALVCALADNDGYDIVYVHSFSIVEKRIIAAPVKASGIRLVVALLCRQLLDVNGRFHVYTGVGARQAAAEKNGR